LDSARNLESTIEAAKALLSEEKMTIVKERAEEFTESKQTSTEKARKALISSEQGFNPKTEGTSKSAGAIRQKALYCLFFVIFGIWSVLLLAVYLPISGLKMSIFPFIIYNTIMMFFLASATIASIIPLFIGIKKLRGKE
jgi:uncharacterized membrane protein YdbT with pleckstrin-like domain